MTLMNQVQSPNKPVWNYRSPLVDPLQPYAHHWPNSESDGNLLNLSYTRNITNFQQRLELIAMSSRGYIPHFSLTMTISYEQGFSNLQKWYFYPNKTEKLKYPITYFEQFSKQLLYDDVLINSLCNHEICYDNSNKINKIIYDASALQSIRGRTKQDFLKLPLHSRVEDNSKTIVQRSCALYIEEQWLNMITSHHYT